jgi:microsomal prostaglandin-E synthase 2
MLSAQQVPVVKLDDEVVVDSSAIVSRLQAELQAASSGKGWCVRVSRAWGGHVVGRDVLLAAACSTLRVSLLACLLCAEGRARWCHARWLPPLVRFGKGGSKQAAARGGGSSGSGSADEVRWRKWVDDRFVKVLTANIYRTWE